MHFICRSFLGHTEENSWSQYWENEPDDPDISSQKGHLFALVNIVSDQDLSSSEIGHQLIDDLNQSYFMSDLVSIPDCLQSAIQTVFQKPQYDLTDISLSVAVVHQSDLYLVMQNSGYVFLIRDHTISKIMSGNTGKVTMISGKIQANDLIFFCTSSYFDNATWDNIKSYLSSPTIEEIEESILSDLYTLPNQPTLASLLIGIYEDKVTTDASVSPLTTTAPAKIRLPAVAGDLTPEVVAPSPSVYVTHLDSSHIKKRRQLNIIFSLIILFVLSVSIFFGARRNQQTQVESDYQSLKSQYLSKIDNAKAIKNVNLDEAQKLATDAKALAVQLQKTQVHPTEVTQFIAAADSILSQTGSADSYQPESFHDTTLINTSSEYSQLLLSKNNLYLLDRVQGRLDRLDISTKSKQKIVESDIVKNSQSLAENNGQLYLLSDKQVYLVSGTSLVSTINLSTDIKEFSSGQITMWNGSLYLLGHLSSGVSNIWKFNPSGTNFSSAQIWLKDTSPLPPTSTSFAINGQVWVISKTGQITPYTRGSKEAFTSQAVSSLQNANHLVTALDSEILAFTEGENIVYIYHKDGATSASYNFGSRHILDIALDSSTNRLFVLCSDKMIYQIRL